MHAVSSEEIHQSWKSGFLIHFPDKYRFLSIDDQFSRLLFCRPFLTDRNINGKIGVDQMKSHDIAFRVVQRNVGQIEIDDIAKQMGKLDKELRKTPFRCNGFGQLEQCGQSLGSGLHLIRSDQVSWRAENSTLHESTAGFPA